MGSMVATVGRWPHRVSGEWSVEMLDDLPDDGLCYEIIDGILQVSPSPTPAHQHTVLQLAMLLSAVVPDGYQVFVAPLDWQPDRRTSLQPDVLVVPTEAIGPRNITGTPLLVIEVASPSTARIDRLLKFSRYADGGVAQYWLVDPDTVTIEVFDLVDGSYQPVATASGDQDLHLEGPLAISTIPAAVITMR